MQYDDHGKSLCTLLFWLVKNWPFVSIYRTSLFEDLLANAVVDTTISILLLVEDSNHRIHRLKTPHSTMRARPPSLPHCSSPCFSLSSLFSASRFVDTYP